MRRGAANAIAVTRHEDVGSFPCVGRSSHSPQKSYLLVECSALEGIYCKDVASSSLHIEVLIAVLDDFLFWRECLFMIKARSSILRILSKEVATTLYSALRLRCCWQSSPG